MADNSQALPEANLGEADSRPAEPPVNVEDEVMIHSDGAMPLHPSEDTEIFEQALEEMLAFFGMNGPSEESGRQEQGDQSVDLIQQVLEAVDRGELMYEVPLAEDNAVVPKPAGEPLVAPAEAEPVFDGVDGDEENVPEAADAQELAPIPARPAGTDALLCVSREPTFVARAARRYLIRGDDVETRARRTAEVEYEELTRDALYILDEKAPEATKTRRGLTGKATNLTSRVALRFRARYGLVRDPSVADVEVCRRRLNTLCDDILREDGKKVERLTELDRLRLINRALAACLTATATDVALDHLASGTAGRLDTRGPLLRLVDRVRDLFGQSPRRARHVVEANRRLLVSQPAE